jgi:hypothetical protein
VPFGAGGSIFAQAEVEHLHTRLREHDVRGLQIAMHDPFAMRRIQRARDLNGQRQCLLPCQGGLGESLRQCFALSQFHHDRRLAGKFLDSVNGADIGMIQGGGSPCLPPEAIEQFLRRFRRGDRQKLERHLAAQFQIFGAVYHARIRVRGCQRGLLSP